LRRHNFGFRRKIQNPWSQNDSSRAKVIVDNMGGTEYGPTTSFRDLVRTVVRDTNEFFSVAAPMKFKKLPEPVFVSVPR
jgi:malate/lactate dehydrogenase